jgi:hypothetical protein
MRVEQTTEIVAQITAAAVDTAEVHEYNACRLYNYLISLGFFWGLGSQKEGFRRVKGMAPW